MGTHLEMVEFKRIEYKEAVEFLLPRHYSGRKPVVSHAFGAYDGKKLVAVCTFGKPASNTLCKGVCGEEYSSLVYELNRLCIDGDVKASKFVSWCLRELSSLNIIVVSYADTAMTHTGYVYQACNFIYTGKTARRTDKYTEGNKHSRHYDKGVKEVYRKVRSAKHRYVYFTAKNKLERKKHLDALNYPIKPYPKGVNSRYVLGEYYEPEIIRI